MNRFLILFSGFILTFLAIDIAHAAENQEAIKRGKEKIQMCIGCHGIDGWHTAFPRMYHVPRLNGQHEAYLKSALEAYKNGDRSHPTMRAVTASLSDQDIADLAAYYASQKP